MWTFIAIPATCWLCALIAVPRRPRLGNEIQELVYTRLLGRQQHVVLVALVATAVVLFTLVAQMPARIGPGPDRMQNMDESAEECVDGGRTCVTRRMDGTVHVVSLGSDGMWHVVMTSGE